MKVSKVRIVDMRLYDIDQPQIMAKVVYTLMTSENEQAGLRRAEIGINGNTREMLRALLSNIAFSIEANDEINTGRQLSADLENRKQKEARERKETAEKVQRIKEADEKSKGDSSGGGSKPK